MCEIYSGAAPALFELKTRSVRLGGVVTSIRLEAIFWQLLEDIAAEAGLSLGECLSVSTKRPAARKGESAILHPCCGWLAPPISIAVSACPLGEQALPPRMQVFPASEKSS